MKEKKGDKEKNEKKNNGIENVEVENVNIENEVVQEKEQEQEQEPKEEQNKEQSTEEKSDKKTEEKEKIEKESKEKDETKTIEKEDKTNKEQEEKIKIQVNENKNNKNIVFVTIKVIVIIAILSLIVGGGLTYFINKTRENTEFKILGDKDITLEIGEEYKEEGFIAKSNNKDINDKVKVTSNLDLKKTGSYKIAYNLKINYLNLNETLYRNIYIKDSTKPELTVNSEKDITVYIGDKFEYPTYKAIDNYDGDITGNVKVTDNLNLEERGEYEINYSVTDSNGNESTDKIAVKVKKKKNPYIIVSIANQTLQYYEYDSLALTSPVVTGINGKTPKGNFKILNKARNIILKGADYESFVSYWMAFKGAAFGFHDASWRSSFGGNIYKYAGSHGYVNMPYNKVKQLFNIVDIGTPVYIK